MIVDFDELNAGAWFDFEDSKVLIRAFNNEILREIRKKTIEKKTEYKKKQNGDWQKIVDVVSDDDKMSEMLWDYCIMDWTFTKKDGNKLECNIENKSKLMLKSPKFYRFVDDAIAALGKDKEKDDISKN